MARRVPKKGTPTAPKGAADVSDVEILNPDHEVTIGGRLITVREYRFWEGLKLRAASRSFFDDLYRLFAEGGTAPSFEDVAELLGAHQDAVVSMIAQASGCDPAWILELDDRDGDALALTWWLANSGFFIRRVLRRNAQEMLAPSARPAGPASSTSSSPPATPEPPPTSES